MESRLPLIDEEGEVRELTQEDFAHARPVSEVLRACLKIQFSCSPHFKNPPQPPFTKGGSQKSSFHKGGFRGIFRQPLREILGDE